MKISVGLITHEGSTRNAAPALQVLKAAFDVENIVCVKPQPEFYNLFDHEKQKIFLKINHDSWAHWNRFMLDRIVEDKPLDEKADYIVRSIALTHKHISLWEQFFYQNSSAEYLVVVEDDATPSSHSIEGLRVISHLLGLSIDSYQIHYADLCGHFTFAEIGLLGENRFKLVELTNLKRENFSIFMSFPYLANTTCAYIISKHLAHKFLAYIWCNPSLRHLHPGWLLNSYQTKQDIFSCVAGLLVVPGIFKNMSLIDSASSITS